MIYDDDAYMMRLYKCECQEEPHIRMEFVSGAGPDKDFTQVFSFKEVKALVETLSSFIDEYAKDEPEEDKDAFENMIMNGLHHFFNGLKSDEKKSV